MAGFQKFSRNGRTGYAVADLPRDLLIRLVECPELPLRMGPADTVKAGNSALVVRANLPADGRCVSVAYKRVRRKTWLKRLTQAAGENRTLRSFLAGHRLLEAGVATARPLAVVVPSRFDLTAPSWLATEWLEGASNLAGFGQAGRSLLPRERDRRANAVASAVGGLLGRLHAAGATHRDLKPQNLMARYDLTSATASAFLIDLDGVGFPGRISDSARWKNLSRLAIGEAGWPGLGTSARVRFLKAYLAACPVAGLRDASRQLSAAVELRRPRRAA